MNKIMENIVTTIATELNVKPHSVKVTIDLLDDGSTVPFIARYRKEVTNGLDDTQLRHLDKRLKYLRELSDRKISIINSIKELGKLDSTLEQQIHRVDNKTLLEDIYRPFKSKRRTKGQIAIEAGLQPLAQQLLTSSHLAPKVAAKKYLNQAKGIETLEQALEGAMAIIIDQMASDHQLLPRIRSYMWQHCHIETKPARKKKPPIAQHVLDKYRNYFEHAEPLKKAPSHRVLAMLRGRNDGALQLTLNCDPHQQANRCLGMILTQYKINAHQTNTWLFDVANQAWKTRIYPSLENELLTKVKELAEQDAIDVFAKNLSDLLMAAPAGEKITMGLDPGIRTGVKVAIVDGTGKLLATDTIYPHPPRNQWQQSISTLTALVTKYNVSLVSIGNGTGSRETDKLVLQCRKDSPQLTFSSIIVSEAGASVYSASELAAKEFPQLDVSLRGAVSIARRLQDPLAELVKIEPKAIGVGQYQHDVNQSQLSTRLGEVIEDCVNGVGVDLNMASVPLLCHVSGLNNTLAQNIIDYREKNGRFSDRKQLLKVPRLGPKAYQQAAGFLRIRQGKIALDNSAVHPEAYALVNTMAKAVKLQVAQLIGNKSDLQKIDPHQFITAQFGLPTITDILTELDKPGRDPRPEFTTATFKEGIESIADLQPQMILEGVITNVTNFGAFVDIGVHQDGLVHISALADRFVSDPHEVVKTGQVVKVKVTEVDSQRKRIALTMRLNATVIDNPAATTRNREQTTPKNSNNHSNNNQDSALANAFAKAKQR